MSTSYLCLLEQISKKGFGYEKNPKPRNLFYINLSNQTTNLKSMCLSY